MPLGRCRALTVCAPDACAPRASRGAVLESLTPEKATRNGHRLPELSLSWYQARTPNRRRGNDEQKAAGRSVYKESCPVPQVRRSWLAPRPRRGGWPWGGPAVLLPLQAMTLARGAKRMSRWRHLHRVRRGSLARMLPATPARGKCLVWGFFCQEGPGRVSVGSGGALVLVGTAFGRAL